MLVQLGCFIHSYSFSPCSTIEVEDDRLEEEVCTSRICTDAVDGQEDFEDPNLAQFMLSCSTVSASVMT